MFTKDGKIIMTVGMPTRHGVGTADDAQNPANHAGKILRLNDDGTVPSDNPFVGKAGYRPELFALGIRNATGSFSTRRPASLGDRDRPDGRRRDQRLEARHELRVAARLVWDGLQRQSGRRVVGHAISSDTA